MRRELVLNSSRQETRVALLEEGLPVEIYVERSSAPSVVGNIYKARVSNVLPGMQSAFVDIGQTRDAFLYLDDLLPPTADPGAPSGGGSRADPSVPREASVGVLLREGEELLVQVTKEALGGKGPRVTAQISLPGRSLVFLPGTSQRVVSRRVTAEEEKDRLLQIVASLPGEGGFIVRTSASGATREDLELEAELLRDQWREIESRAAGRPAPSCVHAEADLALKMLRDFLTEDVDRVVIDREETYRRCRWFAERSVPGLAHRIEKYSRSEGIFEAFGVEKELARALRRRVWLPSGGYIVIHPTEALVAIDVNTGKYVGKTRLEDAALRTNLEAAREIVRQIRLRDLGGILVIDFIDLGEEESRRQLAEALESELKSDRARSRVLQVSEFGLVEITRQRIRRSLENVLCRTCPTCRGSGRLRSAETLCSDIQRETRKLLPLRGEEGLTIRAHPEVAAVIEENLGAIREDLGIGEGTAIRIEVRERFHPEEYEIATC